MLRRLALLLIMLLAAAPASAAYLVFDFSGQGYRGITPTEATAFFAFDPSKAVAEADGSLTYQYSFQNLNYTARLLGNDINFSLDDGLQANTINLTFQDGYLLGAFPLPSLEFRGSAPGENIFDRVVTSSYTASIGGQTANGQITGLYLRYFDETYPRPSVGFSTALAVPEPGTWLMMLLGFGAVGTSMRRRKHAGARGAALS